MDALNVLVVATAVALAGILLALGVRRLLGRRLPLPRSLRAGVGACSVAVRVADTSPHENPDVASALRPGLVGSAVAVLAGMAFSPD